MKDPREYSLLHGLSDFWTRFFADTAQLEAFYAATEVQLAQAYLDLLSAFLGISLQDIPLFSKEYFRLITIREDAMALVAGLNAGQNRYVHTMEVALTQARTLQNKIYQPTGALVVDTDFDLDSTAYQLEFMNDVTGQVGAVLATAEDANLLTFSLGPYTDLYVLDDTPFTDAKPGDWVRIANSLAGNNRSFRIAVVVDPTRVQIEGSPTLPDLGSGSLRITVISSDFLAIPNFGRRQITVETGGSFDDPLLRQRATEQQSWAVDPPIGLGVRKGDILHVLDHQAVPATPGDFTIGVVRHDKLCLATTTPVPVNLGPHVVGGMGWECTVDPGTDRVHLPGNQIDAGTKVLFTSTGTFPGGLVQDQFYYIRNVSFTPGGPYNDFQVATQPNGMPVDVTSVGTGVLTVYFIDDDRATKLVRDYVVLRVPADTQVTNEQLSFVQTGVPKTGSTGTITYDGTPAALPCLWATGHPFAATDRRRYVTLTNCATITGATCAISVEDGKVMLRRVASTTPIQPFARTGMHGVAKVTSGGQQGEYTILAVSDNGDTAQIDVPVLTPETVLVDIEVVTNAGTYQIRSVSSDNQRLYLDQPLTYPDSNVGVIGWTVHDGYQAPLAHTRIHQGTFSIAGGIGSLETGDYRTPTEGLDYIVDYEVGRVTQIGRLAGTWSLTGGTVFCHATYQWLMEVIPEVRGAVAALQADDNSVEINEVAFWAPDVRVDHFRLYDNFGALINRFQPSTEDYRQFIRGVFQLYILGPTLARIESALNVVCAMPVIRDDGEVLLTYDGTSDPNHLVVRTRRLNGITAEYLFPPTTPLREDVTNYDPATSTAITFQSFETLTTLFQVTDYIEDPTWWDSILLPLDLMPKETTWRRTTMPQLYENIVGQVDDPHIGDPGLFIGADEDGVVPPWFGSGNLVTPGTAFAFPFVPAFGGGGSGGPTSPAKRRKMANIVADKYIKRNLFYVHFDVAIATLFPLSFINDLRELVLIAKPGYALAYVEPTSSFRDALHLAEKRLQVHADVIVQDPAVLLVDGSWSIGDFWRLTTLTGQVLLTSDGVDVHTPITLPHVLLTHPQVHGPAVIAPFHFDSGGHLVPLDYGLDQLTGVLTPLTIWPAGVYTIDYSYYTRMHSVAIITPDDIPLTLGGYATTPMVIEDLVVQDP